MDAVIWDLCSIVTGEDILCFFFSSRRRHTRFKCDWSSDVCSSDLCPFLVLAAIPVTAASDFANPAFRTTWQAGEDQIGRASWRGKGEISGGAVSFKKKKHTSRSSDALFKK